MKFYRSFLIRCWLIEDSLQVEKKVIDVEHIQSGNHTRVADMTAAEEWMFSNTRSRSAEPGAKTKRQPETETDDSQARGTVTDSMILKVETDPTQTQETEP